MSSLSPVGRSAAASQNDRASLCSFTFSDGRRCRTPRFRNNPRFCPYHAQKEARARTARKLGKDLTYFFSGDYLSACDLSTALARLIPAVVRGDVKPKTAHTVAYLIQTLMQAIHISEQEYFNAFGTDGWRKAIRNSVNGNYEYLFPPDPDPQPEPSESPQPQPQPTQPQTQAQQPASTPPSNPPQPAAQPTPAPPQTLSPIPTPVPPTPAPAPSRTLARGPQTPAFQPTPPFPGCHPERSEGSHPIPATQSARSVVPAAQPSNPPRTASATPRPTPTRDSRAVHFDHSCRLLVDGKPF